MIFINLFKKNLLIRVIGYTGFTGVLRLIIGVGTQKIVAVFLGASGLAVLANVRNFIEILTSFSSFGAQNGIISKTASIENKHTYTLFLSSCISLFISASFIIGAVVYWQQQWIASSLHLELDSPGIIWALVFVVPFMGFTVLMEAILSGWKSYKPIANIQLLTAFVTALLMFVLIYLSGLKGAIIALLCRPVIGFLFYLVYFQKLYDVISLLTKYTPTLSQAKELVPYISMTLLSTGFVQVIEIWLRNLITDELNLNAAGLWTAVNNISAHYFVFISFVFTLYVLPRFSENIPNFSLYSESRSVIKTLMVVVVPMMLVFYFLREPIVYLLYSEDFLEIASFFKWQLIADCFRVVFLVFAYYVVAKKRLFDYFLIELFSFATMIGLSIYLVKPYGIEGVLIANTIRYVGCLVLVVFLLRKKLFFSNGNPLDRSA